MRASEHMVVACQGGDQIVLERRPVPETGAGELLLRLRVVGFCGTDLFKLDTGVAAPGSVLGHELVGEVVEVGPGTAEFAPGDRVTVPHHVACGRCALCRRGNETLCPTFRENLLEPGGFADYILVRPRAVTQAARRLPEAIPDEAAVFMEPAACVLRGVERSGLAGEGLAVVQGAGSMGLLHLLVLRAARPDVAVLVVDPVEARRDLARELGAAAATAPGAATDDAVASASDALGADAVFDTVGGAALLEAALGLTREGGSVVLFAHAPDGETAGFDLNALFKHERRVVGTYSGGLVEQAAVFEHIRSGRFDPAALVSHRLPLDDFARGVELARRREALKILFTPSQGSA